MSDLLLADVSSKIAFHLLHSTLTQKKHFLRVLRIHAGDLVALGIMRMLGHGHTIIRQHILIGSENVAHDGSGWCEPTTPAFAADSAQHIAFAVDGHLQFGRHTLADNTHAIFVWTHFVELVAQHFLWKPSFALHCLLAFHAAVTRSLAFPLLFLGCQ